MNHAKLLRTLRHRAVIKVGAFALALWLLAPAPLRAQGEVSGHNPLFADESPLTLTIAMDFKAVLGDRAEERDYRPATLYELVDGVERRHEIGIKTRGYYRLHFLDCDVPPLRLNFKKNQVAGTTFEGEDKLKLVTHCKNNSDRFQQFVFQEYLIYRAYNLLTDASFLARLVHVTYLDATGRHDPVTGYGFLIEDEDRMAERNGASVVSSDVKIFPSAAQPDETSMLALFQYMIGNTDWTMSTHHNIRTIFVDSTRTLVAVPYDFDWSGLIGTPYARPFPELNLRSVRERRFMGLCRDEADFERILQRFAAVEDEILALFADSPYLDEKLARRSAAYLEEFFDLIRQSRKIQRELAATCL